MHITLKKIINHPLFNGVILFLIIVNSITIGLQTVPILSENPLLSIADKIFLYIFVAEILLKIIVNKKFFFYDAWNIFDVFIILFSTVFTLSTFTIFRTFRIFRLFRATRTLRYVRVMHFLPNSENLQKIVASISRAIPKIISTGFLLILIFYIYAVLGVAIYGATQSFECTKYFGNLISAFKTLFQVMTGDSWASGVGNDLQGFHPSIWIYLISFYLITALTLLSVVTGVIVDSISSVSEEFEKGNSRYTKDDHILILGFNEIALYVLDQINSYEKDSKRVTKQRVLILDNSDMDKNRTKVLDKLGEENCLNVSFFTGEIDEKENIEKCNVAHAKSILLIGNDETKTAKIILTVRSLWEEKSILNNKIKQSETSPFFATIVNSENLFQSLQMAFPSELEINKHIHILSGEKIISNVLAHSCRKSGFSEIFKELFTSEKNEIYVKDILEVQGDSFYKAALSYKDSTLIGYLDSDGKTHLNPQDKNIILPNNSKGIFLSGTKDTIKYKSPKQNVVDLKVLSDTKFEQFSEKHILFVGCNKYLKNILVEFDNYVGAGSTAIIFTNKNERDKFKNEIEALTLQNFKCDFTEEIDLKNLSTIPEKTEVIVFLTNSLQESNEADSEVLMNLLTLISSVKNSSSQKSKYRLLCEMRKIENQSIAPKNKGASLNGLEYVVGNRLTSQVLAQIALDENLHGIYEELLSFEVSLKLQPQEVSTSEDCNSVRISEQFNKSVSQETEVKISGDISDADFKRSKIYMRTLNEYGLENEKCSVLQVTEKVFAANEIFIGYVTKSHEVILNPSKTEKLLDDVSNLIVLAK